MVTKTSTTRWSIGEIEKKCSFCEQKAAYQLSYSIWGLMGGQNVLCEKHRLDWYNNRLNV